MNFEDIRLIKQKNTGAKKFGYWVQFKDQRPSHHSVGNRGRINLIRFIESCLGPIGQRWQYQKLDQGDYILKLNSEHDLLIFMLRIR